MELIDQLIKKLETNRVIMDCKNKCFHVSK